ncbi:hypothetical protein FA13DRAFT_1802057 [Coprinellus micaceus]|uniref:Stc1 domain-containing protein n=1 Tax=Coprinellus micaceus TaxID=71717 RepID=A0A4Y7SD06_COPMI|nr:hypothetical protein FA13DRAFT_1802057 [Coprinellus micaceus]
MAGFPNHLLVWSCQLIPFTSSSPCCDSFSFFSFPDAPKESRDKSGKRNNGDLRECSRCGYWKQRITSILKLKVNGKFAMGCKECSDERKTQYKQGKLKDTTLSASPADALGSSGSDSSTPDLDRSKGPNTDGLSVLSLSEFKDVMGHVDCLEPVEAQVNIGLAATEACGNTNFGSLIKNLPDSQPHRTSWGLLFERGLICSQR